MWVNANVVWFCDADQQFVVFMVFGVTITTWEVLFSFLLILLIERLNNSTDTPLIFQKKKISDLTKI